MPGTAMAVDGAHWHFFFAWVFLINGLALHSLRDCQPALGRDLAPTRGTGGIGASILDHLRFKHPDRRSGEALQRAAEARLSHRDLRAAAADRADGPRDVAVARRDLAGWVDLVGGRQSARSIISSSHAAGGLRAVHVFEVIITGLWNDLRSMITGRYRVSAEGSHDQAISLKRRLPRRRFSPRAAGTSGAGLAGCDRCRAPMVSQGPEVGGVAEPGARKTRRPRKRDGAGIRRADLSPTFRSNGTVGPGTPHMTLARTAFPTT